jgi:hypothetical protein
VSLVEANHNLLLDEIDSLDDPHVAIEHVLVVVVLGLDDLVAYLESPAEISSSTAASLQERWS